jgi:hypothetical protein
MYKFSTITSENQEIELVCLYSTKTGLPVDVSIEFKNIMDKDYPTLPLVWDNDHFIFGKFYRFLTRWDKKSLKKKDEEKFKDIWHRLTEDLVKEMLEMLDSAIMDGWYERKTK